jgi:hypothetical protein
VALLTVRRSLEVLLALVLLFEEWGWRPLADLLGRLRRFAAWERVENQIADLPPYAALGLFTVPVALLFPLKLLALYLIAGGHLILAGTLFVAAKVIGTAVVARIFVLTQPKLMEIGWFARTYNWLMPWKEALFEAIRATWAWRYGRLLKARTRAAIERFWKRLQPQLRAARQTLARVMQDLANGWGASIRNAWRKVRPRNSR